MKKAVLLVLALCLSICTYCQSYKLQYNGVVSNSFINGYMRDASFFNDTCYFIAGGGSRILLASLNGTLLNSNFANKTFDRAKMIHVNDTHVVILEKSRIGFYTKRGVFVREISISPNVRYYYFWVKSKSEIMLVTYNSITVYNYSTGAKITQYTPPTDFQDDHFVNDGQKMFNVGRMMMAYECRNRAISAANATTAKYTELYKSTNYYFLSCIAGDVALWFEYTKRDTLYVVDHLLTKIVGTYPLLPISQKPSQDELETESGNPHLKIFYNQSKIYVLKLSSNRIEFYSLIKS